jgi:hypothetical protein
MIDPLDGGHRFGVLFDIEVGVRDALLAEELLRSLAVRAPDRAEDFDVPVIRIFHE